MVLIAMAGSDNVLAAGKDSHEPGMEVHHDAQRPEFFYNPGAMSYLVRLTGISLAFGDQQILREADMSIEAGENICLIGRNGAGKSTTLKIIAGRLEPDDGKIEMPGTLRMSMLDQQLAEASEVSVRDFVTDGLAEQMRLIAEYHALSADAGDDRHALARLDELERRILARGGWSIEAQVDAICSQLELPLELNMRQLSGGWRRRVALAQALVGAPDLLLLDEPTNHLDISTIEWLEQQVRRYEGAVVFVTHDRSFVERVATRIVDLDRGKLRSWPGGYHDYLRRRAQADAEEDRHNREFDKKLAEEEAWIRQGIKARATRNEGRVRELMKLREERAGRLKRARTARIHINQSDEVSGRKVIEIRNVSHSFGQQTVLRDFSLRVMRGDRIGIIGNNGVGKSTLLRIMLGELAPDKGSVKLGTNLHVGYFDQLRRELDTGKTVADIVGEGRDYITLNGRKKHVVAYLTDFLFTAKRALTPVAALSGGERNRVILAKLFTQAANLLILDEPTNDLDVETLEALEQKLLEYEGTLIVVSHDRHFLDAVVTSTLVFESDGQVRRHAGNFSDWQRLHRALQVTDTPAGSTKRSGTREDAGAANSKPKKLSYKLQRELDALPDRIAGLEASLARKQRRIAEPEFYAQAHEVVQDELAALTQTQQELDAALERWMELEEMTAS
jgi:ATP-binding cassette subfamily F protein uup